MTAFMFQSAAEGSWSPDLWFELWRWLGAAVFGLGLLAMAGRAWLRRSRYRAVDVLGPTDLQTLHDALRAAERRTVGEIVPMVFERADAYPEAPWRAAVLACLAGTTLLAPWLPWHAPLWLIACQLVLGGTAALLAVALADFRRRFVSEARATELAEEQALQEFFRHRLHQTAERTGVLLFVCLLERRVIVLGDSGIDAKIGAAGWTAARDAVLAGVRTGSLRDGLLAGIAALGDVLAAHFPWREGDRNEIPDRLIVQRE